MDNHNDPIHHSARLGSASLTGSVRALFDLSEQDTRFLPHAPNWLTQVAPAPGTITLITGPSGAGKSRLLRSMMAHLRYCKAIVLDPTQVTWTDQAVIDCIDRPTLNQRLEILSRVGLGDAWTFVQKPSELSDGQRWRFVLAMLLCRAQPCRPSTGREHCTHGQDDHATRRESTIVIAMDEFASLLDRVTAAVVARSIRRLLDRQALTCGVIVATAHDDLEPALRPDCTITCDFGAISIHRQNTTADQSPRSSTG